MSKTKTFINLIKHAATLYADKTAYQIRTRENYKSITYKQFHDDVCNLAAAIHSHNLHGVNVALLGENSYDWVVTYMATVVSGSTIVPIDKELSNEEIATIVRQSGAKALFCSDDYSEVADELKKQGLNIAYYAINIAKYNGYTTIGQLIDAGQKLRIVDLSYGQGESDQELTASIVFTSGTTGFSKGVMLSRNNLLTNVESADKFIRLGEITLSVLPMHHTYEFTLDILFAIYQGRTVAINNSIKYLAQNIKLFAPTDMLIVPLVAENLVNNIFQKAQTQGSLEKLQKGIKISNFLLKFGIDVRRKLFKDIHEAFGGRLSQLFIGGAPLNPETAKTLHALGIAINIGYGITECSPLVSGNITNKVQFMGSCGTAIPDVEIRIMEANEHGDGEIEVRGASVMKGYYNNEDATRAVFNGEWFRTGDIGRFDSKGMLYITGRVKNLIVLKNGKNVYPEELENLIEKIPQVAEVIVSAMDGSGAGEEKAIVAEVFPDFEHYPTPYKEIENAIDQLNNKLPYYKRIIEVKYREKEFEKTTTKKIKRY